MPTDSRFLEVSWTEWKVFAARPDISTYYTIVASEPFDVIAIDPRFVYRARITASTEIADFVTNYQPTSIEVLTLDDAVALANKLDATNSVPYDTNNNPLTIQQGTAVPTTQGGTPVVGTDGTNARIILVDTAGRQKVDIFDSSGNVLDSTTAALNVSLRDGSGTTLASTTNALNVSMRDGAGNTISSTGGNLAVIPRDTSGNVAVITKGGALPGSYSVSMAGGSDGTNARPISVDASGKPKVDLFDASGNALNSTSNALNVSLRDGSGTSLNSTSNALNVYLVGSTSGGDLATIVDTGGNTAVTTRDAAMPSPSGLVLVGGTDGTNARTILLDSTGKQKIDIFDSSGNSLSSTTSALNVSLRDGAGNTLSSSGGNLAVISRDAAGNVSVVTKDAAMPASTATSLVGGTDGTNARTFAVDTAGRLKVDNFDGSGNALNSTTNALNVSLRDGAGNTVSSTGGNLAIIPRDTSGNVAVTTKDAAMPGSSSVVLVGGTDGTNARTISVDSSGKQKNDIFDSSGNSLNSTTNALNVSLRDGSGNTLNSSSGSLDVTNTDGTGNPAIITKDAAMPGTSGTFMVGGTDGTNARTLATDASGRLKVDNFDASGNALNSTTNALNVSLRDGAGNTVSSTGGNLAIIPRDTAGNVAITTKDGAMPVSSSVVLVGGTDGANARTISVDATGKQKIDIFDSSGTSLNSTSNALNVSLRDGAGNTVSSTGGNLAIIPRDTAGNVAVTTKDAAMPLASSVVLTGGTDGVNARTLAVDSAGRVKVDNFDGSGNSLGSTGDALHVYITGTTVGGDLATLVDSGGNVAVTTRDAAMPSPSGVVLVGGSDGTNARTILLDATGKQKMDIFDSAGNTLTSTSSALDVNLKSQTSAIKVSKSTADNAVGNPIFVQLSDGAATFGGTGNPVFVNLKDGSGNALTSTAGKLDVGLTGANTVKLTDSAGTAITLTGGNLKTSIFDAAGDAGVVADGAALPASRGVVLIGGSDGSNIRLLKTDASGDLSVTLAGTSTVRIQDSSGNTLNSTSNALNVSLRDGSGTAVTLSGGNLKSSLFDSSGNPAVLTDNQASPSPGSYGIVVVGGNDGTNIRDIAVDSTGRLKVDLADNAGNAITLSGGNLKTSLFDAGGDASIVADGAALPGSRGVVLIGGSDGSNIRLLKTDASGDLSVTLAGTSTIRIQDSSGNALNSTSNALNVSLRDGSGTAITLSGSNLKSSLFDASGNPAVLTDNQASPSPGSYGVVVVGGNDGSNIRDIAVDSTGKLNVNISKDLNVYGTRMETSFGQKLVSQEGFLVNGQFINWIPDLFQREVVGSTGYISNVNSKARIGAGLAVGSSRLRARSQGFYVAGTGINAIISIILSDTGSSGNIRIWGLIDDIGQNGFFFRLNGTTLEIVRRSNNVDTAVAASSWNIDSTIVPDTNGHIWSIRYQWTGVGRIVFYRDGREVHSIEFSGTSAELSVRDPYLILWIDNQNTSAQGADRYIEIGSMAETIENFSAATLATQHFSIRNTSLVSVQGGQASPLLGIQFRATKQGINNRLRAKIKKIVVITTTTGTWRIIKNSQLTGTVDPDNRPADPATEWSGMTTPFTSVLNATTASGTGYSNSQTVQYKITSYGVIGESLPSTATSSLNVGTPKKQVVLTWNPITFASAYGIYRQVGGAGSFLLIGITSEFSFIDDAYAAQAGTPPGSNTAEGASFMQGWRPPTAINGGRIVGFYSAGSTDAEVFMSDSDEQYMLPGETLAVDFQANSNGQAAATVEWDEGGV